jgi:ABC-type phosphate transport system permease subunit
MDTNVFLCVCVCVIVNCKVQSCAVSKSPTNPIFNPIYSHSYTWQYIIFKLNSMSLLLFNTYCINYITVHAFSKWRPANYSTGSHQFSKKGLKFTAVFLLFFLSVLSNVITILMEVITGVFNNYFNFTGRFYRVLTMVYNTLNYLGFGLYPSSGF